MEQIRRPYVKPEQRVVAVRPQSMIASTETMNVHEEETSVQMSRGNGGDWEE